MKSILPWSNLEIMQSPKLEIRLAPRMRNEIRRVLSNGTIELEFQPKVDCASGRASSAEALVRWRHPSEGLLGPRELIGEAKRLGVMTSLTDLVLDRVGECLRSWDSIGCRLDASVNLSPADLEDIQLEKRLESALARSSLDRSRLILELSENTTLKQCVAASGRLARMRADGWSLSLDDFGTGQTSLTHLATLPIQELKIDRSVVDELAGPGADRSRKLISSGLSMGLHVVAEGVATVKARENVQAMGVHEIQGFLIAEPMPPEQIPGWVADFNSRALEPLDLPDVRASRVAVNSGTRGELGSATSIEDFYA